MERNRKSIYKIGKIMLNKEQILLAKPVVRTIDVPDLGGEVGILLLPLDRAMEFVLTASKHEAEGDTEESVAAIKKTICEMCAMVLCDEDGKPLFSKSGEELATVASATLVYIMNTARDINTGVDQADVSAIKKNGVQHRR